MLKIFIFLFSWTGAKHADFLHSRGLVLENETAKDAIFYSQIEKDNYYLSYPIPAFPKSFNFKDGCYNIRNSSQGKDTTELLNGKMRIMLRERINKFFFGESNEGTSSEPLNDTELMEEAEEESFAYIPHHIFQVSERRFRGLPVTLSNQQLITPIATSSSELGTGFKARFPKSLYDKRTETYIGFDCERSNSHEIRFIVQDSIDMIALIIRASGKGYNDFGYDFRIVQKGERMTWKTEVVQACGRSIIIGRAKPLPIALWSCDLEINKPTEFHLIMDLGQYCNSFRISDLMIFPKGQRRQNIQQDPIKPDLVLVNRHLRKRKQFGEFIIPAAIGLIAGVSSAGGLSYSMHRKDQSDIKHLQKTVTLNEVHEEDYRTAYSENAHETAIVNNASQAIIEKLHEEQCRFISQEQHFTTENFIELVIQNFLAEIETTLTSISIPLPNNPAETLSINLCRSRNREVHLVKFCAAYYSNKDNYKIEALYFENLKEDDISAIIVKVSVAVPLLTSFGAMSIHKLTHIPLPLFVDKNGLFHFQQYNDLPTYFANFPGLLNRKVGLDECTRYEDIFFCDYNTLNKLYTNSQMCLNSVLTSTPSCERTIIKSISNCLTHFGPNYLILSHVGSADVTVVNDNVYHNIQLFNTMKTPALQKSNVTFISSEEVLQIECHLASFRFVGSRGKQIYATHKTVENISATFPLQLNEIDDFENFQKSDKEIDDLIAQLGELDDEHMKQTLELAKRKNTGEAGLLLNMDPEDYELWREFGIPFGLGIVSVLLLITIGCILVRKIKKKWTLDRTIGESSGSPYKDDTATENRLTAETQQ